MNINKLKFKGFSILATVAFLVAIVLINVFTSMLTERFFLKADLTDTGLYTISERAMTFLSGVDEVVDVIVLSEESAWQASSTFSLVLNTLQNYSAATGGRLRVQYVNPDLNTFDGPTYNNSLSDLREAHTELENMRRNDIIFLTSRRATAIPAAGLFTHAQDQFGRHVLAGVRTDQELVSALTYVLNEKIARVSFIDNHQENSTEFLNAVFERSGYISSTINLAFEDIPEDTIILISSAPKFDFLDEEIQKIEQFLALGGNVILLYDFGTQSLPNLDRFIEQWGMIVENKIIFDDDYMIPQLGIIGVHVVSGPLSSTEAAEGITKNQIPVGAFRPRPVRSIWAEGSMGGVTLVPLVQTFSSSSFAKDLSAGITTQERESGDESGPFVIAYNARHLTRDADNKQVYANLIVSGATLFDDPFLGMYSSTFYNALLIADIANDLNPFGESVFIQAKPLSDNHMLVSLAGARNILIFMVIAMPLAILAIGIFVWRKRRHK